MKLLFAAMLLFCLPALALEVSQPFDEVQFEDQFNAPLKVSSDVKHVIFVAEKDMSKIMTDYLTDTKINLADKNIVYVSDISKMPSLITKTFALPKMRKYSFKVALDKTGSLTKAWPRQGGKITFIDLNEGKVSKVHYVGTRSEIEEFFKTF